MKSRRWKNNKKMHEQQKDNSKKNGGGNMELTIKKPFNCSESTFENTTCDNTFKIKENITLDCVQYIEDDNSITLALKDFDIIVNEVNFQIAVSSIIQELKDYISDYKEEPEYWSTDKKRKAEIKYLINLFKNYNENQIRNLIKCRNGKS